MLISIFVLQLFQHRKRRRTLDSRFLLRNVADFGLRARAYIMLGHIRNAQNELIFDLGQQIKMMRSHHLFRQMRRRIPSFAFVVLVVLVITVALFGSGITIVEVVFRFDQLQQDFTIHRIYKRRIAPLAYDHWICLHMQMQERLTQQEAGLALFALHGPRHKPSLALRLIGQALNHPDKPSQSDATLRLPAQTGKSEGVDAFYIRNRIFACSSACSPIHALRCTCRSARVAASAARQSLRCHVDVPAKMPQNVR